VLDNGIIRVRLDEQTGGIIELRASHGKHNFIDTTSGEEANEYLFLPGNNLDNLQTCGSVKISLKECGPLLNSLQVESDAPGCKRLLREVRVWADADYVEIIDTIDKERAPISSKPGDWPFAQSGGKESLNFGFPFNVPNGAMHLDIPLGIMEPEVNQIPGACKNWLTINRWADVSNDDCGVTWVTLDAPLVEVGEISANLLGSQKNPSVWRKKIARSQKLYSWVMNNHWHTNYRAYQEGRTIFRYVLRPHGRPDLAEAARFATSLSQPLLAANRIEPSHSSLLKVSSKDVTVIALKPADSGDAFIVKLFGLGARDSTVKLSWADPEPRKIWLSDTSERRVHEIGAAVGVHAHGMVTLRAER
jgi:alpha-mannosidase